ncbi:hypothetical protein J4453_00685 [Candidatus Woesearchaeota archaeon]|nr:hypothetical protein [Candidatus Woesearchaeota archaeon]
MKPFVTQDTTFEELRSKYPDSLKIMAGFGVVCHENNTSKAEIVGNLAKMARMTDKELVMMLEKINKALQKK